MAAISRQRLSRGVLILGVVATLAWIGAIAWAALSWVLASMGIGSLLSSQ